MKSNPSIDCFLLQPLPAARKELSGAPMVAPNLSFNLANSTADFSRKIMQNYKGGPSNTKR
jgi:hypothetical protein